MVMKCPLNQEGREEMLQDAGTRSFAALMNNPKGINICVKWVMAKRLLHQFNFAQQMEEEEELEETQYAWQEDISETGTETQEEQPYNLGEQDTLGSNSESEGGEA